ncbi:MAG: hypothetical protein RL247_216 [Actinomycetota bacterium]
MNGKVLEREGKDLRFLIPGLAGWALCAVAIGFRPGWWGVVVLGLLSTVVLILALRWKSLLAGQAAFTLGILTILTASVVLGGANRDQETLLAANQSEAVFGVELRETRSPGARSVSVLIRSVDDQELAGGGVLGVLIGGDVEGRLAYGTQLTVEGFLQREDPWHNESWSILVRSEPLLVEPPGWLWAGADDLRIGLMSRAGHYDDDGGRLLPGLSLGDTTAVDRGLQQAMRDTSLSHLVAVSGANCAIVVGIVVWLISLLGGGVWSRMVGGTLALAGFVVVVTPEPSVVRASIMASVVLVFLALGTPFKGIPVLSVTVLGILAVNPWMALDFAFALSVLASGGILLLVGPLSDVLSQWMPTWLAVVIALPLSAQIACQPVLILLNPVIPMWGVVANALAAPAAPVATITGMAATLMGPFVPVLADSLVAIAWFPASFVAFIGRSFASLPWVTLPWPGGLLGMVSMASMVYGAVGWLLSRHLRVRVILGGLVVLTLAAVMASHMLPRVARSMSVPSDWSLAQCDVGQGDALVIRTDSRTILVDTGKYPELLDECLAILQVKHLDLAIISHFDVDHVGAWPVIVDMVDQVWTGPALGEDQLIVDGFAQAGVQITEVSAGHYVEMEELSIRVLWPTRPSLGGEGNDSSVAVVMEPTDQCRTCVSALFLGDLGEEPQRILMGRENLDNVDVIKVSHHGSHDQFHGLYRSVRAPIALIGVGADNTYGHPTNSVLETLESMATEVLRSDLHGLVTVSKNAEGHYVVWREKAPEAQ